MGTDKSHVHPSTNNNLQEYFFILGLLLQSTLCRLSVDSKINASVLRSSTVKNSVCVWGGGGHNPTFSLGHLQKCPFIAIHAWTIELHEYYCLFSQDFKIPVSQ